MVWLYSLPELGTVLSVLFMLNDCPPRSPLRKAWLLLMFVRGDIAGVEQSQSCLNVHPMMSAQPEPPRGLVAAWALWIAQWLDLLSQFLGGLEYLEASESLGSGGHRPPSAGLYWCELETIVLGFYSMHSWGLTGLGGSALRSQGHQQSQKCPWWFFLLPPSLGWGGVHPQAHIKRNEFCTYTCWPITEPALLDWHQPKSVLLDRRKDRSFWNFGN